MTYLQSPLKYPVKVLRKGKAGCIHYEYINGLIGVCAKCGRTKRYPEVFQNNFNPAVYAPGQNHREMVTSPWRNW
jgi:hypothetical protein